MATLAITPSTDLNALGSYLEARIVKGRTSDDCWRWIGTLHGDGYGMVHYRGQRVLAHRLSFYLHNGYWGNPETLHSCDNPPCTNPKHLKAGTLQENMREKVERGRQPQGEHHQSSILTRAQVLTIRKRMLQGASPTAIARQYGLGDTYAFDLRVGRRWRPLFREVPDAVLLRLSDEALEGK